MGTGEDDTQAGDKAQAGDQRSNAGKPPRKASAKTSGPRDTAKPTNTAKPRGTGDTAKPRNTAKPKPKPKPKATAKPQSKAEPATSGQPKSGSRKSGPPKARTAGVNPTQRNGSTVGSSHSRAAETAAAGEMVRNLGTAPEPRRIGESTVAPGRVLGWAEFGHPDGDPVLWFHGTPGARKQVPPSIPLVALQRGFRIICVERPGTGVSTNHEYDRVIDFASDIEALADDLGLERFGVVGLSGGGPFTLAVCHEMPDRVVAASILGGLGPTRGPDAVWSYTRVLRLLKPGLQALRKPLGPVIAPAIDVLGGVGEIALEVFARIIGGSDKEVLRQADFKAMFLEDIFSAGDLRGILHDVVLFSRHWGFQLADITTPVIVWQGLADPIVPVSHGHHQAARLGNALLRTRPGEGHFAGFSDSAAVLDALREAWAAQTAEPIP